MDSERFYGSPLAGLSFDFCVHTKIPAHSTTQTVSADASQHKFESMFLCLCASVYVYICVAKGNVQNSLSVYVSMSMCACTFVLRSACYI